MHRKQQGFAAIGAVLLLVVVSIVVGGGYYVLKNQDTDTSTSETTPIVKKATITANGTPENAAKAVAAQLDTEIKIEDDGASQETAQTSLDSTSLNGVQESINASKL